MANSRGCGLGGGFNRHSDSSRGVRRKGGARQGPPRDQPHREGVQSMSSTVPYDEQSAREWLRSSRGPGEASNLIARAGTRADLIRADWTRHKEEQRAARKAAPFLYPDED